MPRSLLLNGAILNSRWAYKKIESEPRAEAGSSDKSDGCKYFQISSKAIENFIRSA